MTSEDFVKLARMREEIAGLAYQLVEAMDAGEAAGLKIEAPEFDRREMDSEPPEPEPARFRLERFEITMRLPTYPEIED